jgi:3-oxoacyl-[acyl-carrier protein] reductase
VNTNKVAVVTGGTRGIGRAIVEELAEQGYFVCFTYQSNDSAANGLVARLNERVSPHKVPAEQSAEVDRFIQEVRERHGRIDVLVNNAGITKDAYFAMMPPEQWDQVLDVNLRSLFAITKAVSKVMIHQKCGSIIFMSSVAASRGSAGQTNYAASKGAIISLAQTLGRELARYGVRVNAVSPGFIETDMTAKLPRPVLSKLLEQVPLRRVGKPSEVAKVVEFLASERSSYITCNNIIVDGGLL